MALVRCNLIDGGVKLPDSITLSGEASAVLNPSIARAGSTNPTMYAIGSCTIPTFGYKYANVAGGTIDSKSGNNINISNKNNFVFSISSAYVSSWNIHWGSDGEYPYGSVAAKWTIVLHN